MVDTVDVKSSLQARLAGLNLYLVGMMGAGKTTVGEQLAIALGYRFLDLDQLVETVAKCSIAELFAQSGESGFRDLESRVLSDVSAYASQRLVISTGGGIVLRPENWSYLRHGLVIWLDAPAPLLYERLKDDTTRPLLQTPDPAAALQEIATTRQPLYAQADLHIRIQPTDTPQQLVQSIITEMPSHLRAPDALKIPPNPTPTPHAQN